MAICWRTWDRTNRGQGWRSGVSRSSGVKRRPEVRYEQGSVTNRGLGISWDQETIGGQETSEDQGPNISWSYIKVHFYCLCWHWFSCPDSVGTGSIDTGSVVLVQLTLTKACTGSGLGSVVCISLCHWTSFPVSLCQLAQSSLALWKCSPMHRRHIRWWGDTLANPIRFIVISK